MTEIVIVIMALLNATLVLFYTQLARRLRNLEELIGGLTNVFMRAIAGEEEARQACIKLSSELDER